MLWNIDKLIYFKKIKFSLSVYPRFVSIILNSTYVSGKQLLLFYIKPINDNRVLNYGRSSFEKRKGAARFNKNNKKMKSIDSLKDKINLLWKKLKDKEQRITELVLNQEIWVLYMKKINRPPRGYFEIMS